MYLCTCCHTHIPVEPAVTQPGRHHPHLGTVDIEVCMCNSVQFSESSELRQLSVWVVPHPTPAARQPNDHMPCCLMAPGRWPPAGQAAGVTSGHLRSRCGCAAMGKAHLQRCRP
jgi:hypothetical protein